MSDGKAELRAAMLPSLNWKQLEPGATITPPIPVNRRWIKRLIRWLTRI